MYRAPLTSTLAAMKKHVKIIFVRFTNLSKIETRLNEYSLLSSLTYFDNHIRRERASKGVKEQIRMTAWKERLGDDGTGIKASDD